MTASLIDTSVVIAHDEAGALELPGTAAISVITIGELHAGVAIARDARTAQARRERLAVVRAAFVALPVDELIAERYGEVLAVARSQKRVSKATDLLIIATASATGRELYTLDEAQARLAHAAGTEARLL